MLTTKQNIISAVRNSLRKNTGLVLSTGPQTRLLVLQQAAFNHSFQGSNGARLPQELRWLDFSLQPFTATTTGIGMGFVIADRITAVALITMPLWQPYLEWLEWYAPDPYYRKERDGGRKNL